MKTETTGRWKCPPQVHSNQGLDAWGNAFFPPVSTELLRGLMLARAEKPRLPDTSTAAQMTLLGSHKGWHLLFFFVLTQWRQNSCIVRNNTGDSWGRVLIVGHLMLFLCLSFGNIYWLFPFRYFNHNVVLYVVYLNANQKKGCKTIVYIWYHTGDCHGVCLLRTGFE